MRWHCVAFTCVSQTGCAHQQLARGAGSLRRPLVQRDQSHQGIFCHKETSPKLSLFRVLSLCSAVARGNEWVCRPTSGTWAVTTHL